MSILHAVLAEVADEPGRAAEIHHRLEQSPAALWQLTDMNVYYYLQDGVTRGLLRKRGKRKPVYEITDAGRVDLENWLRAETAPASYRNELYLKLAYSDRIAGAPPVELLDAIDAQIHETAMLQKLVRHLLRDRSRPPGEKYALLGVSGHLKAEREFLQNIYERLEEQGDITETEAM